jgi:hypothetical protein
MGILAHSPFTVARHSCVRSAVESRREKEKMYSQRRRMMRQAFGLGLLVALVVLALSACGGGGSALYEGRRYIKHKVEASNPALWKFWAPNRARGASGATGYLLSPTVWGRKGS